MCHKNYLNYLLEKNNIIYVDTASFMHTESMRKFLENSEEEFISKGKKMVITRCVITELNAHISSNDQDSSIKAKKALEIIEDFQDLFIKEENEADSEATFADSDFLSKLTLNKARLSQLLITPDKDLALDAFNLNNQGSNKGYRVMVCHINRAGHIKKCDCVNKNINTSEAKEPEVIIKEKIIYKTIPEAKKDKANYTAIAGGIAGGFVGGVIFDRYALPAIRKAFSVA